MSLRLRFGRRKKSAAVENPSFSSESLDLGEIPLDLTANSAPIDLVENESVLNEFDLHEDPGRFEKFVIGIPGRAALNHVAKISRDFPMVTDFAADAFSVFSDIDFRDRVFDVRAASVRGISHRHEGVVRQDAYAIGQSDDCGYLVIAVADGVSSARLSHLAAELVVESIAVHMPRYLASNHPDDIQWGMVFDEIISSRFAPELMNHLGKKHGGVTLEELGVEVAYNTVNPDDIELTPHAISRVMATTVVIGIVGTKANSSGSFPVWIARVGDTSAWILNISPPNFIDESDEPKRLNRWKSVGTIKNEGVTIAESATAALPVFEVSSINVSRETLAKGRALVLMTDGIGDPMGSGEGEVGARLASLWASPPDPIEFAAQCDFVRKSFDDDRTAVVVWPVESSYG